MSGNRFIVAAAVAGICLGFVHGGLGETFRHRQTSDFGAFFGAGGRHHSPLPVSPMFRVRRDFSTFLLADRFLFGRHRPTAVGRATSYLGGYHPWRVGYGRGFLRTPLYSSHWFVQEWRDVRPQQGSRTDRLGDSLLLAEGMNEEQVVGILGSPVRRVEMGEREVWNYSGFSLVFELGELKELR